MESEILSKNEQKKQFAKNTMNSKILTIEAKFNGKHNHHQRTLFHNDH